MPYHVTFQEKQFKRTTSVLCHIDVMNKKLSMVELNVMSHYLIWRVVVLSSILGDVMAFQQ